MKVKTVESGRLSPGLYLVATPIGNLRDISLRAMDVLSAADLLACEDTRITGKLLELCGLKKKKMVSCNEQSEAKNIKTIIAALEGGQSVALVSDAGTPLISDPGYRLVRECRERGAMVTAVPGPCAPVAALQLSGLPSDSFAFIGFLPAKREARRKFLQRWANVPATLLMFETAPRIGSSLVDMADVFGGERPAAIVREITKKFEETRRGNLAELRDYCAQQTLKGEIVVVVGGRDETKGEASEEDITALLRQALRTMSVRDAASFVAEQSGANRRAVYRMALAMK